MAPAITPAKNMGPLNGHEDQSPAHPLRTVEFVMMPAGPIDFGDDTSSGPLRLTMPSFGTTGSEPLNRPLVPSYHLHSPTLPQAGGGTVRTRGPEGSTAWTFDPIDHRRDIEGIFRLWNIDMGRLGLRALGDGQLAPQLNIWINKAKGTRPPQMSDPPYVQLTDSKLVKAMTDTLKITPKKAAAPATPAPASPPPPATPPAADDSSVEVHFQAIVGYQNFQHTNLDPTKNMFGPAHEGQAVLGVAVNFQFHDDLTSGLELQSTFQANADVSLDDPNASAPPPLGSTQPPAPKAPLPLGLQENVAVSYVVVVSQTLQIIFQAQGYFGFSSQTDSTHRPFTKQNGFMLGMGLNYKLDNLINIKGFTLGILAGPGMQFQPESSGRLTAADTTRDFTAQVTCTVDFNEFLKALKGGK